MPTRPSVLSCVCCLTLGLPAQETPNVAAPKLDFQMGLVTVAGNLATIELPDGWFYLQQSDARHVAEHEWRNPPDPNLLGLAVRSSDPSWGIRVSYEAIGHVGDVDVVMPEPRDLLRQLRADNEVENGERRRGGFPEVTLEDWVVPPRYDAALRQLSWATALRFAGEADLTLNYDVRLLAAEGVLVFSAVAKVADSAVVAKAAQDLVERTKLAPGRRYGDFDADLHRVADRGLGGLVTGQADRRRGRVERWLLPCAGAVVLVLAVLAWRGRRSGAANA